MLEHALSKIDFSVGVDIYASMQFELKHWKQGRKQQQNSSKQQT